jgi:hypothetical protein
MVVSPGYHVIPTGFGSEECGTDSLWIGYFEQKRDIHTFFVTNTPCARGTSTVLVERKI